MSEIRMGMNHIYEIEQSAPNIKDFG